MENARSHHGYNQLLDRERLSMVLAVIVGLAAAGIITYASGGTHRASPHLFYVPIILAAYAFKLPGAILTSLLAGLICGPLMPLNTESGEMQATHNWSLRAGFFVAVGLIAGSGFQVMSARLQRQLRLHEDAVRGFVQTIDAKSPYTAAHSQRVAMLAIAIGEELGMPPSRVRDLYWAGLLHDVGKLWVDDKVLDKRGPLTEEEWRQIRQHPIQSADFIAGIAEFARYSDAARHHHERYDGGGYPDGLKGTDIPFEARILAVADAFEAMTAERPYRPPLTVAEALDEVERNAGTQFDPDIARVFIRAARSRPLLRQTSLSSNDEPSTSVAI